MRNSTINPVAGKGSDTFQGIKLWVCENLMPQLEEAIAVAKTNVLHGNQLF
jgi:hypothetical protein